MVHPSLRTNDPNTTSPLMPKSSYIFFQIPIQQKHRRSNHQFVSHFNQTSFSSKKGKRGTWRRFAQTVPLIWPLVGIFPWLYWFNSFLQANANRFGSNLYFIDVPAFISYCSWIKAFRIPGICLESGEFQHIL